MGLNNSLHYVPVRIEPGQSSLAPPPFNNSKLIELTKLLNYVVAFADVLKDSNFEPQFFGDHISLIVSKR